MSGFSSMCGLIACTYCRPGALRVPATSSSHAISNAKAMWRLRRERALARRPPGGGSMTAPFPTHKQEEWRYADLDALKPVWEQFAEPVTLIAGAGEKLKEVWLPVPDDVQLRRVQLAVGPGARARIFALNNAPVYGR